MYPSILDYVSAAEYAKIHGKAQNTIRWAIKRRRLQTAVKIGRNWLVSRDEPYPTRRSARSICRPEQSPITEAAADQ